MTIGITFIIAATLVLLISVVLTILNYRVSKGTIKPPNKLSDIAIAKGSSKKTVIWSHVATSLGGAVTISFIGLIYRDGSVFIAAGIAFILGLMIYRELLPFMFKHFEASGDIDNFDSYISNNHLAPKLLVSLVNVFIFFMLALAQFTSIYLLLDIFKITFKEIFLLVCIISVMIYLLYGLIGVFFNEKFQLIVIFAWIGTLIYFVPTNFDFSKVSRIDPAYLAGLSRGPGLLIAILVLFPWTALARADLWQRSMSSRNVADAKSAISVLIFVIASIYVLMGFVGITLYSLNPDVLDYNTVAFSVFKNLHPIWQGLAVLGIFAALISSADSMLNLAAVSILNSLESAWPLRERSIVKRHLLVLILLGASSYVLVMNKVDLGSVVILASTASAILVPSLLARIFTQHPLPLSKATSIGSGVVTAILTFFYVPDPWVAFVPAAVVAGIVMLVGARIEQKLER